MYPLLTNDVTNTRYIYVPRECKCPKFTGKMSVDLLTVEQWIEEVHRCLEVRHLSVPEQLLFITDHLEGGARSELIFTLVLIEIPQKKSLLF